MLLSRSTAAKPLACIEPQGSHPSLTSNLEDMSDGSQYNGHHKMVTAGTLLYPQRLPPLRTTPHHRNSPLWTPIPPLRRMLGRDLDPCRQGITFLPPWLLTVVLRSHSQRNTHCTLLLPTYGPYLTSHTLFFPYLITIYLYSLLFSLNCPSGPEASVLSQVPSKSWYSHSLWLLPFSLPYQLCMTQRQPLLSTTLQSLQLSTHLPFLHT